MRGRRDLLSVAIRFRPEENLNWRIADSKGSEGLPELPEINGLLAGGPKNEFFRTFTNVE